MNGGAGPNSYTQNSKFQEKGLDRAKSLLSNSILQQLTIQNNLKVFNIADLGCSVGPNTFTCVQTIIEAVKLKSKACGFQSNMPEFQVFFNDNVSNDFNTLFKALPLNRQYRAAGVPGSFHGRLFPKSSMNLMHCSFALHWLTKVPEELKNEDSPAWNKGRITYVNSCDEVVKAYSAEYAREMEAFFKARSEELMKDGLLVILMPCRPAGSPPSESIVMHSWECISYALSDMAKEGVINEALMDSFNLPIFIPAASEVEEVVSKIECLSIVKMEKICYPPTLSTPEDAKISSVHIRATVEGLISKHFGPGIVDELFQRHMHKLIEFSKTPRFTSVEKLENLFLLVKQNEIVK